MSPETRATLEALEREGGATLVAARRALAADLNAALRTATLDRPDLVAGLELGRGAHRARARGLERQSARMIFGREVLFAAYPEFVSRNVDFRVGYKIDIAIALAACLVTLSTRRGKYADGGGEPA